MTTSAHFDRRGATYDGDETHRRIIDVLTSGVLLQPGMRVLDIGTGTGAVALKAAEAVGTQGSILALDVSEGMLAEAQCKAAEAGFTQVEFRQADAEQTALPAESFDVVFCASALVMMRDIPAALHRWASLLKAPGWIAFDVPAKPFGIAEMIAEAALRFGVTLPYDSVADTPAKCRALVEGAGLVLARIQTEIVSDEWMTAGQAVAFLNDRLDHPAWRPLREAPPEVREAILKAFVTDVNSRGGEGKLQARVAQHFVYGRRA